MQDVRNWPHCHEINVTMPQKKNCFILIDFHYHLQLMKCSQDCFWSFTQDCWRDLDGRNGGV